MTLSMIYKFRWLSDSKGQKKFILHTFFVSNKRNDKTVTRYILILLPFHHLIQHN